MITETVWKTLEPPRGLLEPVKGTLEVSKWFLKLTDGTL